MARIGAAVFALVVVGATSFPSAVALAEPPVNDLFADSVVIDPAELPFADSVDTTEATSDDDDTELGCPAPSADASVWYSITPTTDSLLAVSAEGTDYAYGISVATGDQGSFELIECRPFPFLFDAEADVTYHLQVFDDQEDGGGNGGSLEFTLRESTAAEDAQTADPPDAPYVIETQVTFSESEPPSGPFEVVAGAEALGCSSGTFVDTGAEEIEGGLSEITKVFTCESGPKTGTIAVLFRPGQDVDEPDRQTGPWEVKEGTGDFVGLVGGGDFSVVFDSSPTGTETLAGELVVPGTQGEPGTPAPTAVNTGDELSSSSNAAALFAAAAGLFVVGGGAIVIRRRSVTS